MPEFITIAEVDKSRPNRVGVKLADGSWMGCFDQKLWPRLEAGANLSVEVKSSERDGRTYRNITSILGTAASPNGTDKPATDRERNIVRESALRAACDIAAFVAHDGEDIVSSILTAADRFAAWIEQRDEEAPF